MRNDAVVIEIGLNETVTAAHASARAAAAVGVRGRRPPVRGRRRRDRALARGRHVRASQRLADADLYGAALDDDGRLRARLPLVSGRRSRHGRRAARPLPDAARRTRTRAGPDRRLDRQPRAVGSRAGFARAPRTARWPRGDPQLAPVRRRRARPLRRGRAGTDGRGVRRRVDAHDRGARHAPGCCTSPHSSRSSSGAARPSGPSRASKRSICTCARSPSDSTSSGWSCRTASPIPRRSSRSRAAALERGGGVRLGIGDSPVAFPDLSNAALAERAVRRGQTKWDDRSPRPTTSASASGRASDGAPRPPISGTDAIERAYAEFQSVAASTPAYAARAGAATARGTRNGRRARSTAAANTGVQLRLPPEQFAILATALVDGFTTHHQLDPDSAPPQLLSTQSRCCGRDAQGQCRPGERGPFATVTVNLIR